ncbi:MAG: DUF2993 domain-containing protein [Candidatus Riflebacteria bacterium]|jgi:hypothetical protein|nr:DUF2993 domain-containing protein [Candidatus Riflebacteria bacterium]
MTRRRCLLLLLTALSLVSLPLLADNASYTPDPEITARIASDPAIIERKLISSMNKLLENPASLSIILTPISDLETANGRFKKVLVHTSRGSIDNLPLNRADIDFEDVQLDTAKLLNEEKIDPVSMSNINMDVSILENDLNTFLEAKSKSIKVDRPRIEIASGEMKLSGSTKYGLVKVEFWANGNLSIKDGREIWFHARKMKVNRMTMPRSFVGMIVKKINPVLDLEKFPFKLNLDAIELNKGEMHFTSFRKGSTSK